MIAGFWFQSEVGSETLKVGPGLGFRNAFETVRSSFAHLITKRYTASKASDFDCYTTELPIYLWSASVKLSPQLIVRYQWTLIVKQYTPRYDPNPIQFTSDTPGRIAEMADTQEAPKKVFKKAKTPIKKKPATPKAEAPSALNEKPSVPNTPKPTAPKDTESVEKSTKQASTNKVSFILWLMCLLSPTVLLLFLHEQNYKPLSLPPPKGAFYQSDERERERKRDRLKEYSLEVRRLTLNQCRPRSLHPSYQQHLQLTRMFLNLK